MAAALLFVCAPCALAACGGDGDDSPQVVVSAPQSSYERVPTGPAARGLNLDPAALIAAYGRYGISLRAAEGGPGFGTLAPAIKTAPAARFASVAGRLALAD